MNSIETHKKLNRAQISDILFSAKGSRAPTTTSIDIRPPNLAEKALMRNDSEHCRSLKTMSAQKQSHLLKCYSDLYEIASTCTSLEAFDERAKTLLPPPLDQETNAFRQAMTMVRNSFAKRLASIETADAQSGNHPLHALPADVWSIILSMAGIDAIRARRVCKLFDRIVRHSLTDISLCHGPKMNLSDQALISLALCAPKLREVTLKGILYNVTDIGIFALLSLCKGGLKKLHIERAKLKCQNIISTMYFQFLGEPKLSLQSITLSRCYCRSEIDDSVNGEKEVTDEDLHRIGNACLDLRILHITSRETAFNGWSQDNTVTEEGLKKLALLCPNLETLHIGAFVKLKRDFLLTLPSLFPQLRTIDLSRSNADDNVVKQFAEQLPQLCVILLRGCKISDAACTALSQCRHLTKVDLRDCAEISKQGQAALQNIPALNILISPPKPYRS